MSDSLHFHSSMDVSAQTPGSSTGTPNSRGTKRKESDLEPLTLKNELSPGHISHVTHESPLNYASDSAHGKDPSGSGKDTPGSAEKPSGKRIKTARACDSCRRKKIRCDVIDDGGPPLGSVNNGNGGLVCAHCRQYGFECTFFLPITETRFKKKYQREAEEAAAAAAVASSSGSNGIMAGQMPMHGGGHAAGHPAYPGIMSTQPYMGALHDPAGFQAIQAGLAQQGWGARVLPQHIQSSHLPRGGGQQPQPQRQMSQPTAQQPRRSPSHTPPPDTRVLGPTSIAYLVHSTAFIPGAAIEAHDIKHNQTFEVGASGDGIIRFHRAKVSGASGPGADKAAAATSTTDPYEEEVTRIPESIKGRLAGDVAEKLVNTYFEKVATLFPVVTKSEFLHLSPTPPLLLYAICGVSALSRQVPKEVLGAVKMTINALFRENDFLSSSNSVTVRALLVMSLHADLHGPAALQSGTRCWNRTGAAIRMAQDLGLHRDASGKDEFSHDAFFLEQKRRIWGCCVTADRLQSISLGHPMMIDLTDCDVRLPSPYEILRSSSDLPSDPSTDRPFAYNTEMLKLTILFGRVMKTIYSPTGLMNATDEEILSLLRDIDAWKAALPEELVFNGADSSAPAGILHVGFACLMMLFFRVFMRISYICPTHLKFSLTIERMSSLIQYSTEAIAWVDKNDFYLDTMQIVSYCLVSCATVQYHAFVRRGDQNALLQLKKVNDIMGRYRRENHDADDVGMRGKAASVISLLCDSAVGVYDNTPSSGTLNPTAGVTNRKSRENVRGIVFKPDASRPGGGVYVAADQRHVLQDLPKGTIIMQETQDGSRVPALVRTGNAQNGGWQTYDQYRAALGLSTNKDGQDNFAAALANGGFAMLNSVHSSAGPSGQQKGDSATSAKVSGTSTITSSIPAFPSSTASSADANLDLVHLGGDVYQDAEGLPVTRAGARLLTMVPVGPNAISENNAFLDSNFFAGFSGAGNNDGSTASGTGASNNCFDTMANLGFSNGSGAQLSVAKNAIGPASPSFNFNPHLNNAYWAPAEFVFDGSQGVGGDAAGVNGGNGAAGGGANAVASMLGGRVDANMLDGIPGAPLDFANWDAYFSRINQGSTDGDQQQQRPSDEQQNGDGTGFANTTFGIEAQMMDAGRF
ncbi:Zn(2)-C6 fungal-type DNA-binding domain protein [Kalmanozyma brasiliensis GHG001]|uniref:Zn(2)-C6 fungal-type domain-containing protein n=1 Tax=Kalmanozyma brasiliensis (strain GHG001) TaxID=1365824 RepID=V5F132_KALBG|nr:Zn(2)-C6 fungal-type DNA-binding domain protein [Kalmanozyma brasiliensis GHG001]EST08984.1 Zn(2)-C6 fungal-type DNA-binding domain protein [Kalmanozyma brasiliensis GHG001]